MTAKDISPYFLFVLIAGAFFLAAQILLPFFAPLILAASFAAVLYPIYCRFLRLTANSKDLSALAVLAIVLFAVLIPLGFILTMMTFEIARLYGSVLDGSFAQQFSFFLNESQHWLPKSALDSGMTDSLIVNLSSYMQEVVVWLSGHISAAFSSIVVTMLNLFIFFVALFFFLRDGAAIKKSIIELSPLDDRDDQLIFEKLGLAVNSVIRGNLLIALLRGIFAALGFLFFGLPNPLLWGIVAGVLGLIPGIGVVLVFAPAILYVLFFNGVPAAFGLLIWGVCVVGLIDNILTPYLFGHGLQMHPLFVFLSIFGGIAFFGPVGIFLGPLSLSFLLALLSIYAKSAR